jgi:hypothetical protein
MEKQKDIFGIEPEINDTIIYNPAQYKGLVYGKCIGFSKGSNLPIVLIDEKFQTGYYGQTTGGENCYTPKTGFVIYF